MRIVFVDFKICIFTVLVLLEEKTLHFYNLTRIEIEQHLTKLKFLFKL